MASTKSTPFLGDIDVSGRVERNPRSMSGRLASSDYIAGCLDCVCGIHGAARARKGLKKATSAARRRQGKEFILEEIDHLTTEES